MSILDILNLFDDGDDSSKDGQDPQQDLQSGSQDTQYYDGDGDGIIDTVAKDTNHDGFIDIEYSDQSRDGLIDTIAQDTDGDGVTDHVMMDTDGDTVFETAYNPQDSIYAPPAPAIYDPFMPDMTNPYPEPVMVGNESVFDPSQGIFYPPSFDPGSGGASIVGDPGEAMEHWHQQTHPDTCAVVSQEFVLEELTGKEFDENELRDIAIENGWYTPGGGTSPDNVGKLLEYYGLDVDRHDGSSIEELESALESGDKVIVGLASEDIWIPGQGELDYALQELQGLPGSDANHAVEVIGIDRTDPEHPMVVLNDPGHPGGGGSMVPLEEFEAAWSGSNNFIVTASK